MRGPQRRKGACGQPLLAVLLGLLGAHCGPQFPPSWLIPAEPSDAGGTVDPAGKLRVLALAAEPPEVSPGATVNAAALVVIHPRYGVAADLGGELSGRLVGTPMPRGLSVKWRMCRLRDESMAPMPCGLGEGEGAQTTDTRELPELPGPATQLVAPGPEAGPLPYTLVLTLIAADAAFAGGAVACQDQARQGGGVSPDPDHCVIAVKRIKVSAGAAPNHNPELAGLYLGASESMLAALASQAGSYPRLDAGLADSQRPQLVLAAERGAEAVESEPDPQHPGGSRPETLNASFFTTAGTLEAGRASFLDLGCTEDPAQCPQLVRAPVNWQPPASRSAAEAPDGVVFFFAVLRDDRGGTSFRSGYALAH